MSLTSTAVGVLQSAASAALWTPFENAFLLSQVAYAPVSASPTAWKQGVHSIGLQAGPWEALKGLWEAGGVTSLFRGLHVGFPLAAFQASYLLFRDAYLKPRLHWAVYSIGLDTILFRALTLPVLVLHTNVVVTTAYSSLNPIAALGQLLQEEDGIAGIFTNRRYLHALALDTALSVFTTLCTEPFFAYFVDPSTKFRQLNIPIAFGYAAFAAACVLGVLLPCSTLAARLRLSSAAQSSAINRQAALVPLRPAPYSGLRDAYRATVREEGWAALFRGVREGAYLAAGFIVCSSAAGAMYGLRLVRRLEAGKGDASV